ncbi:MAG: helix-turn-helix transcriptional regulator [Aristaeellaceae bacterium]
MKLSLAANIGRLRRENAMTQEQLAEALGVTFAAVSKWERGVATPELSLIAQMADLFGVSLDRLVGFEMHDNSVTALEERICSLQLQKRYAEAIAEAEKALLRFPNDFRIVYCAGQSYSMAGIEGQQREYLHRGIPLLEHAVSLISQNSNPRISEASIQSEIAQCHLALGHTEKGLEILKKHNVGGVHNAQIALTYAVDVKPFDPMAAEVYLADAYAGIVNAAVRTMMAYANYYEKLGNTGASRDAFLWLADMLRGLKIDPDATAYVDKLTAPCYAGCAVLSLRLGEDSQAEAYLHRAFRIASAFDARPTYRLDNIKFCVGDTEKAMAYDDLGETAMSAVERQLAQEDGDGQLMALWRKLCEDTECGGTV